MKNPMLFFLLFLSMWKLYAQECDNQRYYEEVFGYTQISNIRFGENLQPTPLDPNNVQELFMDIYQPNDDTLSARPLIIWAFGGGFVFGSKTSPDMIALSSSFAKRGYVTAAIDYRLSTDLIMNNDIENSYEAVAKAIHDMRAAIRFFYKDAATSNQYRIDTSRIYIGGVSAGAVTALHIVHLDESEIPFEMQEYFDENGGLSGNSGNEGYSENVAGVISLCGMLLDVDLINPEVTTPIVSMHGTEDGVVPYGSGTITILDIGLEVDGSAVIHPRLDEYNIINDFYTFRGAGHTPFVLNPPNEAEVYMDTTISFVRDFLYDLACDNVTSTNERPHNGKVSHDRFPFEVFPNPNNGNFFVQLIADQDYSLSIFDNLGRGVFFDPRIHQGRNYLALDLPKGVYFVKAHSKGTSKQLSKKIIVH
jgi:pimeloyl-ACP methyl ester carboxylesterase